MCRRFIFVDEKVKEKCPMFSDFISVIALIVSVASLYIATRSVFIQAAEYEYKIAPKIELTASITLADVLVDGVEKKLPLLQSFHVKDIEEHNLDELFLINPRFRV